jgi:hypothetical protein
METTHTEFLSRILMEAAAGCGIVCKKKKGGGGFNQLIISSSRLLYSHLMVVSDGQLFIDWLREVCTSARERMIRKDLASTVRPLGPAVPSTASPVCIFVYHSILRCVYTLRAAV